MCQDGLSIVIPCFNEQARITKTYVALMDDLQTKLPKMFKQYEVLFVNDGSTDNTLNLLNAFGGHGKKVIVNVLSYLPNRGKGYAVRQGCLASKYRTRLILDADYSIRATELLRIPSWDDWAVLKGRRTQVKKQPLHRVIVGKVWHWLVIMISDIEVDSQSPFTLIRKPRSFFKSLCIDGFCFDVEILYKAKLSGNFIYEIPVDYYNAEDSKVSFKKSARMFTDLIRICWRK